MDFQRYNIREKQKEKGRKKEKKKKEKELLTNKQTNKKPTNNPPNTIYGVCLKEKKKVEGERERWQRNRTGRPLSPSQIPQKNISTLSKLHKTTSVGWQRTSGNQKSRSLSSKTDFLSLLLGFCCQFCTFKNPNFTTQVLTIS